MDPPIVYFMLLVGMNHDKVRIFATTHRSLECYTRVAASSSAMKRKKVHLSTDRELKRHSAISITAIKIENVDPSPSAPLISEPASTATYDELVLLHKSLCTIYTFLSSRPHFLATFDKISGTVSAQIGRPLEHVDIAKIRTIIPQDLLFGYVVVEPEDSMQLKQCGKTDEQTLLIEFVDGKLRPSPSNDQEDQRRSLDHAQWKTLRVPAHGLKSIQKLIEKRIARFDTALKKYMKRHGSNWAVQLDQDAAQYALGLILDDQQEDPVEAMVTRVHNNIEKTSFDIPKFINAMKSASDYRDQIVEGGEFTISEQQPVYGELDNPLPEKLLNALSEHLGLTDEDEVIAPLKLYSHQAEAINHLDLGYNVIVSTSTSSGKSMIYQIPILRALLEWHTSGANPSTQPTAIFIFPTKALAQDQMRSFNALKFLTFDTSTAASIIAETYDGDTPSEDRVRVRQSASVIFTNPDMIHANILPNWEQNDWKRFLGSLKYVVVDELHTYTGVFGAHVAYTMRRLKRLYEQCSHAGTTGFQVISCSATISDPEKVSLFHWTTFMMPFANFFLAHAGDIWYRSIYNQARLQRWLSRRPKTLASMELSIRFT